MAPRRAARSTDGVFAASDRRRPRRIAAIVGAVIAVVTLAAVALGAALWRGPDAPGARLPDAVPSHAATSPTAARWFVATGDGGPSSAFVAGGALLLAVALALAWVGVRASPARRRRPRRRSGRWWPAALAAGLVAITTGLVAHRYTSATTARDTHVETRQAGFPPGTGSVLEVGAGGVRSVAPALRHVALTFDDGPDPRWTPAILRVLAREHVVGTFFVIGEQVSAHPDLVRRAVEGGNEVGVHTYRHLEVTHQDAEAFRRDVRLTQLAVVGATGHETVLFRPPFIVNPRSVDFGQYVALWRAGTMGYLTALADRDPADWARPGVRAIVDRAMPRHGAGAIVELHDGGGDRSQTVAALGPLIRRLKRAGYAFDTVGAVARLPMARTMPRAPLMERLWGRAFLTSVGAAGALSTAFFVAVAIAAILSLLRIAVVVALATRARRRRAGAPIAVAAMPSVTVLVAARDEERSLPATLRALCELRAGAFEIVVIDDGSRDGTARVVEEWPDDRVRLVRRAHAGKAAALDAGLAASVGDIVVTVDADTRLERDALRWIVEPFGDPAVGAVSGNLRVRSASGWLGRAQQLEYVVANAFDRRALDALGTQVTVPGAIGAYRRSALVAVGGFDAATMAEDTDLTLALVAAGSTIRFAPEALAYTETPTSVRSLWRQRSRWSFGILQSVWRRRSTCARWATNRRAGATWTFALASQVLLPLTSPLLDVAAAWALLTGTGWLLLVWGAVTVLQLAAAAYALRCEGESWRALWAFPLHVLGYRQLTALVVPQSLAWAASGRRPSWGRRRRPVRATTVGRRPVPARTPAAGRAPRRRREDVAPAPV